MKKKTGRNKRLGRCVKFGDLYIMLKPCPFCGSHSLEVAFDSTMSPTICCKDCGIVVKSVNEDNRPRDTRLLVDDWNYRYDK